MTKVLFILKRREDFTAKKHSHIGLSTGLFNSASFVNIMLNQLGVESNLEVAIDNNDIDRLVTQYKPDYVIIEALWVVPSKFAILQRLHPKVQWIIRLHSELPFMAGEGMAMDWLGDYSEFKPITIAANAPRMLSDIKTYLRYKNGWSNSELADKVVYLPNFYPQRYVLKDFDREKDTVDIGCFGAVRLLKNHLVQAFAAIQFAEDLGKKLRFHINAGRIEMQGEPVLNNLKGTFQHLTKADHQLINHQWTPRDEFLKLCATMDIGMQCNFSETFNIVGADLISQGVPLVGCSEIPWAMPGFYADPNSVVDITKKLHLAYKHPCMNVILNQLSLTAYTNRVEAIWTKYFKGN